MKTLQETIYRCDHCNRPMFGKGAMVQHERKCKENPNNKHQCFEFCSYLERTHEIIEVNGEPFRITHMQCLKKKIFMYSYKLEYKYTFRKSYIEGLTRMPLTCEDYSCLNPSDPDEFF